MSCLSEIQLEIRIFRLRQEKCIWSNAQKYLKQLNLIYLNNDEYTYVNRANGSTDLLDMAFTYQT